MKPQILTKLSFMLLVLGSLVTGIFTGWFRLGFDLPVSRIYLHHGVIMTGSFLGTVILIERISTMKKRWLFLFPLVNVSSIVFFFLGYRELAFSSILIGSAGLFCVFWRINLLHDNLPNRIMWLGSFAWLIGNAMLLFYENYAMSIMWWIAFLLITISGERMELIKFLPIKNFQKIILIGLITIFIISCIIPFHFGGQILSGLSMLLIAIWFLRYDMIRKSIKLSGLHRFSASALAAGFIWLGISGLLFTMNYQTAISYDALIHTFFIGFIFSMIFAHAPIILPGVAGLSFRPFHPTLYIWMILLQISLVLRVIAGLFEYSELKAAAGFTNGIIILLFFINLMIVSLLMWKRKIPSI